MILEVVALVTPDQERLRPSRERVAAQSRGAREALSLCAELAGAGTGPWEKDEEHVPLPRDGWHWSVSHDDRWAVASLARGRIGVDVERIEARRTALVDAILTPAERRLLPGADTLDALTFARVWTAKEAVLKSVGVGLGALSRCVLTAPLGWDSAWLDFDGERCLVRQRIDRTHVLSVHTPGDDWSVRWHFAR